MIRETYKGRQIKVVKGRGHSWGYSRVTLNGVDMGKYMGDEERALQSVRGYIDHADEVGVSSARYGAEWYAPGTYELCDYGHVKEIGGLCGHSYCEERRVQPCANITAGGVCVCDHCMKPYLTTDTVEQVEEEPEVAMDAATPEKETVKAYTPCWTCAQPATHTLTREGSNTLHACDNCTRIDRAEAEKRGWTVTRIKPKEETFMTSEADAEHSIVITRAKLYPEVARPGPAWVWSYNYYVDGGPVCQWGPGLASLRRRLREKYGKTARVVEKWKP